MDEALTMASYICGFAAAFCFIFSNITGNFSQVDRLWSVLPAVYAWVFYQYNPHPKTKCMAIFATMWGLRLSYNFYRKGGYKSGEEDYRWPYLRTIIKNKFLLLIFNLTFISIYQNIILLLIASPAWQPDVTWKVHDCYIAIAWMLLFGFEVTADQQQWNFHKRKARKDTDPEVQKGFCTSGLWYYSRHPNFFAEISLWYVFYAFSISSYGLLNWRLLGAILLHGIFLGSTPFTESITEPKYPLYKEYQKTTSRIVPWFGSWDISKAN